MDISTSHSRHDKIGEVFTPVKWAQWLITRWGIFDAWRDGASVCDPTAGQGAFILALFKMAQEQGFPLTTENLSRLSLIEINPHNLHAFSHEALTAYGVRFPEENMLAQDVILQPSSRQYDILVGNPPWVNFADLPEHYKNRLAPLFVTSGLVPDRRKILLGASRVDLAALVLKHALGKLLRPNGRGYFFLPTSLFFGDDAHRGFRDYAAEGYPFAIKEVYEFTQTKVFESVGTSYCAAWIQMGEKATFPIPYIRETKTGTIASVASPLHKSDDPWRVYSPHDNPAPTHLNLTLPAYQKPRQGVNTCGANEVFIFHTKPSHLPEQYLYPLATKEIWCDPASPPAKWILLPYDPETGRPLSLAQFKRHPSLIAHLEKHRDGLERRKGVLIRSAIEKGFWWSLLGVGRYSFAPYKIMWEAYGQKEFRPIILHPHADQQWQANQSMHAFIPAWSRDDAIRIHEGLLSPDIPTLLKQMNGEGKCNWAQPGKVIKLLDLGETTYQQSSLFERMEALV